MNFVYLRAFHAVANEGSFTRAAQTLRVSQPTLSGQVKALEETYGVRLLDRRGQRVVPTDAGRSLLEKTREIFRLEDETEQMLDRSQALQAGRLKIGADGPRHVVPVLAEFAQRYPNLDVSLATGNARKVLQDLYDYQTDVAVLALEKPDARLFTIPFRRYRLVAYVARSHPWAKLSAVSIRAFANERLIIREPTSFSRQIFDRALAKAQVRPASCVEMDSREASREAVALGMGVGVMGEMEFMTEDQRMIPLPVRDARLMMSEYVACLAQRRDLRIIRAFFSLCKEKVRW